MRIEDQEALIDEKNSKVFTSFFSADRQEMCAAIAHELGKLCKRILERSTSAGEFELSGRLCTLHVVLLDLTTNPKADIALARTWLADVDVHVTPRLMNAQDEQICG
jgi:hypothetical protein